MAKIDIVCPVCGSKSVGRDATASWCVETQDWELSGVMDSGFCNDCGRDDLTLDEEEIDVDHGNGLVAP